MNPTHGDASAGMIADGGYRYLLWRRWADAATVLFVMLNPSTADHARLDPTIRRVVGFARSWGFGAVEIANLFALRATDPRDLAAAAAPVGASNDAALTEASSRAAAIVVAWGTHGRLADRDRAVAALLAPHRLRCLGVTRSGAPRHPLYLPAVTPTRPWHPSP